MIRFLKILLLLACGGVGAVAWFAVVWLSGPCRHEHAEMFPLAPGALLCPDRTAVVEMNIRIEIEDVSEDHGRSL